MAIEGREIPLRDGLLLRPLRQQDASALYSIIEENRNYLAEWMPWAEGQTLEGTLEFIRSAEKQQAEESGFHLAIVSGDEIIGVVGMHPIDQVNRHGSLGYWISEAQQGRGTVTAAVRALTDHAFDGLGLNRVEIQVAPENERSVAIARSLGFAEEGVLREVEHVGSRFLDHIVFSLLRSDRDV